MLAKAATGVNWVPPTSLPIPLAGQGATARASTTTTYRAVWSKPDKHKLRSSIACAGLVCFIPLFGSAALPLT